MQNDISGIDKNRINIFFYFCLLLAFIIICRLIWLQVIKHPEILEKVMRQRQDVVKPPVDRGNIYDRNGNLLAITVDMATITANPPKIKDKYAVSVVLSKLLKVSRAEVYDKISKKTSFVYIKRKIEPSLAKKIEELGLVGIGVQTEKKRVYPNGKVAASILGFVGMDNEGLAGVERSLDDQLKGEQGVYTVERDEHSNEILPTLKQRIAPTFGKDLTLSIDMSVQYFAEKEISKMVTASNGVSGTVIVMDIKSGEILALATYPTYDPNDISKYSNLLLKCSAIQDPYEPGSTFKLITIASALDQKVITRSSLIDCPDTYAIGGKIIKNSHASKFGTTWLTPSDILCQSVNTGVATIADKNLGKENFYRHMRDFGFGEKTGIELPGESRGILKQPQNWDKPDIAMMGFGQSIAVTPIQLLSCVSAMANDGIRIKPILVKKIESTDQSSIKIFVQQKMPRAISEATARDMMELSEEVVVKGTGKPAQITGFSVGGKTGTAQKVNDGVYIKGHYISSFIGFAPISDPRIAALVIVDDPKPVYWGERIAAPVFKDVVEFTLRRLDVVPDKPVSAVI